MNHSKWNVKLKIIWNYFLACLIAVIVMIPFLWMLSTSLKSKGALMQIPIEWIPQNPTLDSYRMVFSRFPFLRAILNSFFITCSYTAVYYFVRINGSICIYEDTISVWKYSI